MCAEASAGPVGSTGLRISTARSVAARARAALGARASPAARSAQHVRDPSKRRASSKSHNAVRDGCEIKSWQLASPKKAATRSQSRGSVGADALPPRGRSKASAARERATPSCSAVTAASLLSQQVADYGLVEDLFTACPELDKQLAK